MPKKQPKLGRRHAPDDRDYQLKRRRLTTAPEPSRPYTYHRVGKQLYQGMTGTCVPHAGCHIVNGSPVRRANPNPFDMYRIIVAIDEWSDNDFEASQPDSGLQFGTSVRAGVKAFINAGYINGEYQFTYNVQDAAQWVWKFSPVWMGTIWTASMFEYVNGKFAVVDLSSGIVGGHSYVWDGVNMAYEYRVPGIGTNSFAIRKGKGRFHNTWEGQEFFWLTFDQIEPLISRENDGEVCLLTELAA